jgi:hypothetical protein
MKKDKMYLWPNKRLFPLFFMLTLLFGSQNIYSQVKYTDIKDTTITGWNVYSFHFFLPHDSIGYGDSGTFDIWIHPTPEVVFNSLDPTTRAMNYNGHPAALNKGVLVDPALSSPTHPSYASLNSNGTTGNWIGVKDKYLGLYFIYKDQLYCGWARLDIDSAPTYFTLKDYACSTIPVTGILTGEGIPTVIKDDQSPDQFKYYLSNGILNIDEKTAKEYSINIYNVAGKLMATYSKGNCPAELNFKRYMPGIYLLNFNNKEYSYTAKVFLKAF